VLHKKYALATCSAFPSALPYRRHHVLSQRQIFRHRPIANFSSRKGNPFKICQPLQESRGEFSFPRHCMVRFTFRKSDSRHNAVWPDLGAIFAVTVTPRTAGPRQAIRRRTPDLTQESQQGISRLQLKDFHLRDRGYSQHRRASSLSSRRTCNQSSLEPVDLSDTRDDRGDDWEQITREDMRK